MKVTVPKGKLTADLLHDLQVDLDKEERVLLGVYEARAKLVAKAIDAGMTQVEIAKLLGVSQPAVAKLLRKYGIA